MNKFIWGVFLSTLLFVSLMLAGCQKEVIDEQLMNDPQIQRISKGDMEVAKELLFLRDVEGQDLSDYSYSGITKAPKGEIQGGFYMIGGDMMESRAEVQRRMRLHEQSNTTSSIERHRKISWMASSGSKTINILNGVPSAWTTAIANARTEWNNLGQGLTFTAQAGGTTAVAGAINVRSVDFRTDPRFDDYVVATTYLPASGVVQDMYINSYYANSFSDSQKKFIIAHELAHSIGFAHTDTYERDAIDNVSALSNCRNNPDPNSVWRPGPTPAPSWTGFSSCDVTVFGYYYGYKLV